MMANRKKRGAYGARPFDPIANAARSLLKTIQEDLGAVDFFTRDDLLHLDTFAHVATITRYQMTCQAVRHLIETGRIVEKSRTDLCLPGKSNQYGASGVPIHQQYELAIRRAISKTEGHFSVATIIHLWRTDPQLTENAKRVAIRRYLAHGEKQGWVEKRDDFTYQMRGDS